MYEKFFKRALDLVLSLCAFIVISPLLLILTVIGAAAMHGNPFFSQPRPGKDERIFRLLKFKSMRDETGADGKLLPDGERLTAWGRFLRSSSLDELPSLINIIKGDLAIVGPRPQLVRDMVFMSDRQRRRHSVRQGMTGLAQVSGRNSISWEKKLDYDLEYIDNGISFINDVRIILRTISVVFKHDDINSEGMDTSEDFGDYLLRKGEIDKKYYDEKQEEALRLLRSAKNRKQP